MISIFNPYVIGGAVLVVGVVAWQAHDYGYDRCQGKHAQAALAQAIGAQSKTRAAQTAVNTVATKAEEVIEKIRIVTRTIVREVPRYVTPETDRRLPLSVGFERVHDAAALGVDVSAIPLGPGESDGSASTVAPSQAAGVITDNYGRCRETAERLKGLQGAWDQAIIIMAKPTQ
jgi:hypothetical protein